MFLYNREIWYITVPNITLTVFKIVLFLELFVKHLRISMFLNTFTILKITMKTWYTSCIQNSLHLLFHILHKNCIKAENQDVFFGHLAGPAGAGSMAFVCQVRYTNSIELILKF